MRVALHWRGRPLLAIDVTAQSPADDDNSLDPPWGIGASAGGLQERAEPFQPDTTTFGITQRPESLR